MCGCLLHDPHWAPGQQPRHVPWLGIEPVTLWFAGWRSICWATPATAALSWAGGDYMIMHWAKHLRFRVLHCKLYWNRKAENMLQKTITTEPKEKRQKTWNLHSIQGVRESVPFPGDIFFFSIIEERKKGKEGRRKKTRKQLVQWIKKTRALWNSQFEK